jgi:DNA polymerase-3 subunit gamma/tau
MALALARRYRPKRFSDLIVQDHVAAVLRGAVARDRVGHGYLLTGPRGVGKTTAARILAMALNCERKETADPPGEPCGECANCQRIWGGAANLDVVEIDAASNRGVEDARDLRERALYAASQEGHHKIYIVDEAHMLTREAWNALLKILEEPPSRVVFVFATTEPQKIAQTAAPVLSRLQRFDFHRIGPAAIRDRLRQVLTAEGITAEDDAVRLIARHADGGMRDALSLLDQCLSLGEGEITAAGVREILGLADDEWYGELLSLIVERRPGAVFPLVDRLLDHGVELNEFLNGAAELLRALLMLQLGAEPPELTEANRRLLTEYRDRLQPGDVLRMLKLLTDAEVGLRRSGNPRLVAETILLRWAMMDRIVQLEQVLSGEPARPNPPARAPSPAAASPAPAPPVEHAAPGVPPAAPGSIPFTLDGLQARWAEIAAAAREHSRVLGPALEAARPVSVSPPEVAVTLSEEHALLRDGLRRQQEVVTQIISRGVGAPVRLVIVDATAPAGAAPNPRPRRLSEEDARAERLRTVQGKDPALRLATGELDLEIVE